MSHVLITGAAGFLGVAISGALETAGHRVTRTDYRPGEGITALDIGDGQAVDRVVAAAGPIDAIVHLAAAGAGDQGLVAGAQADPSRAVRVNIEGFTHLARAAAQHGVPRLLWSSSTTAYGPAGSYSEPISEAAPFAPETCYGATKAACEHLGPVLAAMHGIEVVSARLPMVYGQGRWYGGSQAPLVDLVDAAVSGRAVRIEAWTGDGDWIHVDDAASAFLALVQTPGPLAGAYHLVGHRGSLAELAEAVVAAAGADPERAVVERTGPGAPDLPATDDAALRAVTGWSPRHASAVDGAAAYVQHAQNTHSSTPEEIR